MVENDVGEVAIGIGNFLRRLIINKRDTGSVKGDLTASWLLGAFPRRKDIQEQFRAISYYTLKFWHVS
jgi:hypothetical protein